MADKTAIEWTDATWNPIRGCSRVSEGCKHCYAEGQAARIIAMDRGRGVPEGQGSYDGLLRKGGQWNGKVRKVPQLLDQPLRWTKPRLIFVNSMSDLFHEDVPFEFAAAVFGAMSHARQHTFQVLTKRPARMLEFFTWLSQQTSHKEAWVASVNQAEFICGEEKGRRGSEDAAVEACAIAAYYKREQIAAGRSLPHSFWPKWPLKNVWIGVSVEDQATSDERVPLLMQTPAAVRWISAEPLLGAVDLSNWLEIGSLDSVLGLANPGIDWVVVGGESGPNARPMHPEWVRAVRRQCAEAAVPFLFKQWGEWVPRSACYHTFEDGKSCGDMDPLCQRWQCIRLTYQGHDGRQLDSDTSGGSEAYMQRVGKKFAGRLLDGKHHDEYPEARP